MLFNEKWNEVKLEPFTKEHVKVWLETKDPEEQYCYTHNGECLIAQYLKYLGHRSISVASHGYYRTAETKYSQVPTWLHKISVGRPWSFGAALDRLNKT